jgi:ABC-type glutathione transport system ATPase component
MALLLITHDLGVVARMADRIGVMYAGQLVEEATREAFFARRRIPIRCACSPPCPMPSGAAGAAGHHSRQRAAGRYVVPRLPLRRALRRAMGMNAARPPPWRDAGNGQRVRCVLACCAAPAVAAGVGAGDTAIGGAEKPLLEVEDLKVHFPIRRGILQRAVGAVRAVDGVSLQLLPGRTLALVGESGCGKTTAGKAMLQLIRPTAGSVQLMAWRSPRARRRNCGRCAPRCRWYSRTPSPRSTRACASARSSPRACARWARRMAMHRGASPSCWKRSACAPKWRTAIRTSSPAASASALPSPVPWR